MSRQEALERYLKSLSKVQLVYHWNLMSTDLWSGDDFIYHLTATMLDEMLEPYNPARIVLMVMNGNMHPGDDYFKFDGCGNLESGCAEKFADIETLAYECIQRDYDCGNPDIRKILDAE